MFNFSKLIAVFNACIAMMMAAPAQASLVDYQFTGSIDSGALTGESYFGSFNFDDASLTHSGNESVNLSALSFHFMSSTFDLSHADAIATADFLDGALLGISYSVSDFEPAFALISAAGTGLAEDVAYFAYTPSTGEAGFGSLTLTSVPLPGAIWLFGSSLGLLIRARRRGLR